MFCSLLQARLPVPRAVPAIGVLVALVVAASGRGVAGETPSPQGPDRSSPRATFRSFLDAMNSYKMEEDAQKREQHLVEAKACLDLTGISALLRQQAGTRLVVKLKVFLDKTELIDLKELPEKHEGPAYVWRKFREGVISVTKTKEGLWQFSGETLETLPALLETVRDRAFVEGIRGGGGARDTFADWLRKKLPAWMSQRKVLLENWQWIALAIVAVLGVIVERLVSFVVGLWVGRWSDTFRARIDKRHRAHFGRPLGILAMVLLWRLLLPLLDLPLGALAVLYKATGLVMAVSGVWAALRVVDLVGVYFSGLAAGTPSRLDDLLVPMVRRALKTVVIAFGLILVAENLDIEVTSLLAGLGIGGVALALAAKDTVENFFGSLTVLIDRPFEIGDWVVIGDLEGTVEELGFRSTRVRTFYNSLVTIPNSRLVNASVDNMGRRRYRRVKCMIAITRDTPPETIDAFCEGIRELIRRHPYTRKDYYLVYFNQFADSAFEILLYAFHEVPDWGTELRERHRLFVDIVRLAQRLGVVFAYPTRTVRLTSAPPAALPSDMPAAEAPAQRPAGREVSSREEAVRLGRAEAEAIVREVWGGEAQPPVDFADPAHIGPAGTVTGS